MSKRLKSASTYGTVQRYVLSLLEVTEVSIMQITVTYVLAFPSMRPLISNTLPPRFITTLFRPCEIVRIQTQYFRKIVCGYAACKHVSVCLTSGERMHTTV